MRLLDLFCGAGGAAVGYASAGFDEIVGVDINPQPHYPFEYIRADALQVLDWIIKHGTIKVRINGAENVFGPFDAIHASPPCQRYSRTAKIHETHRPVNPHPDLIAPVRSALKQTGLPYIIENVPGAPLIDPVVLCGTQFHLRVYRHRLFEGSCPLRGLPHQPHSETTGSHRGYSKDTPFISVAGHNYSREQGAAAMGLTKMGRPPQLGTMLHIVGHFSDVSAGRAALEVPWMTRDELSQAIPPAYTEYIGKQLLAHLQQSAVA